MNGSPSKSPRHRASPNPARSSIERQLGRRIHPQREGPRFARRRLAVDQRVVPFHDGRGPGWKRPCSSRSRPSPTSCQSCSRKWATSRSRCMVSTRRRPPGRRTRPISARARSSSSSPRYPSEREEVEGRVEAAVRERQLAVVGLHELRPAAPRPAGAPRRAAPASGRRRARPGSPPVPAVPSAARSRTGRRARRRPPASPPVARRRGPGPLPAPSSSAASPRTRAGRTR